MAEKKVPPQSASPDKERKLPGLPPGFVPTVVVKFKDKAAPKYRDDSLNDQDWKRLVERFPGVRLKRLFTTVTPERIRELEKLARKKKSPKKSASVKQEGISEAKHFRQEKKPEQSLPNFLAFFAIVGMQPADAPAVAKQVSEWARVETAYVDPPCRNPCVTPSYVSTLIADHSASGSEVYLDPVNAPNAWRFPGGDGAGQHLVDLEMGWQFCHRDLRTHFSTTESPLLGGIIRGNHRAHGIRVLGIICGHPSLDAIRSESPCCIGITPHLASVKVISYVNGLSVATEPCVGAPPASAPITRNDAIIKAISHLQTLGGGVLLLEAEIGSLEAGIFGSWAKSDHPIEIIPTDLAQIQLAMGVGVVVIEAAGNAGRDLDQYLDADGRHSLKMRIPDPIHPSIMIPNPHFKESGAIMVGASKRNLVPEDFSNYGSRVNCFALGEDVFSTNLNGTYTSSFDGTSSASAIIAGVALSVLGIIDNSANGLSSRTPQQIRDLLSNLAYGTDSAPGSFSPVRKIGSMPDLRKLIRDGLGLS